MRQKTVAKPSLMRKTENSGVSHPLWEIKKTVAKPSLMGKTESNLKFDKNKLF
jgi:hypothetical protein